MTTMTPPNGLSHANPAGSGLSPWMTTTEAARYLSVEPRTLALWARQGKVRGHILSGTRRNTWRFLRSELDDTMKLPSVALAKGRIQ
jgi:excisionase family DNA binding protein